MTMTSLLLLKWHTNRLPRRWRPANIIKNRSSNSDISVLSTLSRIRYRRKTSTASRCRPVATATLMGRCRQLQQLGGWAGGVLMSSRHASLICQTPAGVRQSDYWIVSARRGARANPIRCMRRNGRREALGLCRLLAACASGCTDCSDRADDIFVRYNAAAAILSASPNDLNDCIVAESC